MIPTDQISVNVGKSIKTFQEEGAYPCLFKWCTSQLDNWTDSLMLENAVFSDANKSLIDKAMNVYAVHYKDKSPVEELSNYYDSQNLDEQWTGEYGRYWHGYLVFLKPALLVLNYAQIRMFNLLLQSFLTVFLLYILFKRKLIKLIVPYVFSVLLLMPIAIGLSMQFSTVYYIFTIVSITILIKYEYLQEKHRELYFFVLTGMITSYLDFLTYPIATLGIPLTFYIELQNAKERKDFKFNIRKVVLLSAGWGVGYAGMWCFKWLIGSVLTQRNLVESGIGSLIFRTTPIIDGEKLSLIQLLIKNVNAFFLNPMTIYVVIYMIICVIKIFKDKNGNKKSKILNAFPFIMISLMPYVWWLVASNHSWEHYWFTNKAACVFVFAFLCSLRQMMDDNCPV